MYIILVFLFLFFLIGASAYLLTSIFSILHHSPYVPTADATTTAILNHARLKPGSAFLDLGAGSGCVVAIAQNKFRLKAIGYEVNPILCIYARLRYHVTLICTNFFTEPWPQTDIIYIYLFPKLIVKLEHKILTECNKETIIISYSFPLLFLEDRLTDTIVLNHRDVFYYKI